MIQRVQSLFLAVVVLCGILVAIFPPYLHDSIVAIAFTGVIICNIVMAIVSLFLYKKRYIQMRMCYLLVVLNLLLLAFVKFPFSLLLVISIISAFLARRYIKKDEELVRSADRIR